MAISENKSTDTRTFRQIWESLNESEKNDLTLRLFHAKCCITRQSIRNWARGIYVPGPLVKDKIAETVSRFTGRKTPAATLFPAQR